MSTASKLPARLVLVLLAAAGVAVVVSRRRATRQPGRWPLTPLPTARRLTLADGPSEEQIVHEGTHPHPHPHLHAQPTAQPTTQPRRPRPRGF